MAFTGTVEISKSAENPQVARKFQALLGPRLNTQIARGVQQLFQAHLFALDAERANPLGGQRTHFYGDAAKATSGVGTQEAAEVTVAMQGIRQRRYGGTINARPGSWLTIPARAEAYGKRAREFGDLEFIKLKNGNAMLVAGEGTGLRMNSKGEAVTRRGMEEGLVMYWLVKSVTQEKDESVLPTREQIDEVVIHTIDTAWVRAARATGSEGNG